MVIHKYCADTDLHRYLSVLNSLSFLDDGQANVFQKLMDELAPCHLGGKGEECNKIISKLLDG